MEPFTSKALRRSSVLRVLKTHVRFDTPRSSPSVSELALLMISPYRPTISGEWSWRVCNPICNVYASLLGSVPGDSLHIHKEFIYKIIWHTTIKYAVSRYQLCSSLSLSWCLDLLKYWNTGSDAIMYVHSCSDVDRFNNAVLQHHIAS